MNILITGASGFVGPVLSKLLKEKYLNCTIFGTYYLHHEKELFDKDITSLFMDLSDKESIKRVLHSSNPDYIFHLAAQSSVKKSWDNPTETMNANVIGSINLIEELSNLNSFPRILIIGSSEQYGKVSDLPINESNSCKPVNPYGISKKTQEELMMILGRRHGLDIMFTRSFNHTGVKQSSTFVIPDWCKQISEIENKENDPIISVGNIDVIRDFSDVEDICDAYIDIIIKGDKYEIYNVGSGKSYSLRYILKYLLSLSKKQITIIEDPCKIRPAENPVIKCNNTKLFNITGKKFKSIENLLEDILNYWRSQSKNDKIE